LLITQQQYLAD